MLRSDSIASLALALSKAQGAIRGAVKDSDNPFFKSKYADLASVWEACRKPLTENELSVVQTTGNTEQGVVVETTLFHSSGEWVGGTLCLKPVKDDPQGVGSAITYARRYGLAAIVGIAPEDDDGNAASMPQALSDVIFHPNSSTIHFGKHKGQFWGNLPADYLEWLIENGKEDSKQQAQKTIEWKKTASVVDEMFPEGK